MQRSYEDSELPVRVLPMPQGSSTFTSDSFARDDIYDVYRLKGHQ